MHIGAPSETPMSTARSDPVASITARTSSIRSSSVGAPTTARSETGAALVQADQPRERRQLRQEVSGGGVVPLHVEVAHEPLDEHQVRSPSPTTWYAMWTPSFTAYWTGAGGITPLTLFGGAPYRNLRPGQAARPRSIHSDRRSSSITPSSVRKVVSFSRSAAMRARWCGLVRAACPPSAIPSVS